jgi:endonuclease YncB( thermonuclease family)
VYNMQGESIDEMLVREGLAQAWERDGQHRGALLTAESRATEDGVGCLWSVASEPEPLDTPEPNQIDIPEPVQDGDCAPS